LTSCSYCNKLLRQYWNMQFKLKRIIHAFNFLLCYKCYSCNNIIIYSFLVMNASFQIKLKPMFTFFSGTGTFGRVYLVRHRPTNKYYAMKTLKKTEVVRLKQVEHINSEKQILSSIKHPFIVNLYVLHVNRFASHLHTCFTFALSHILFSRVGVSLFVIFFIFSLWYARNLHVAIIRRTLKRISYTFFVNGIW
jgi:hypothetical protein